MNQDESLAFLNPSQESQLGKPIQLESMSPDEKGQQLAPQSRATGMSQEDALAFLGIGQQQQKAPVPDSAYLNSLKPDPELPASDPNDLTSNYTQSVPQNTPQTNSQASQGMSKEDALAFLGASPGPTPEQAGNTINLPAIKPSQLTSGLSGAFEGTMGLLGGLGAGAITEAIGVPTTGPIGLVAGLPAFFAGMKAGQLGAKAIEKKFGFEPEIQASQQAYPKTAFVGQNVPQLPLAAESALGYGTKYLAEGLAPAIGQAATQAGIGAVAGEPIRYGIDVAAQKIGATEEKPQPITTGSVAETAAYFAGLGGKYEPKAPTPEPEPKLNPSANPIVNQREAQITASADAQSPVPEAPAPAPVSGSPENKESLNSRAKALGYSSIEQFNTQNVLRGDLSPEESQLLKDFSDHNTAARTEKDPAKLVEMDEKDFDAWIKTNTNLSADATIQREEDLDSHALALEVARKRGDQRLIDKLTEKINQSGPRRFKSLEEMREFDPNATQEDFDLNQKNSDDFRKKKQEVLERLGLTEKPAEAKPNITQEASDLLNKLDQSGSTLPSINNNVTRILRENGIEVTDKTTPEEAINALREKSKQPTKETPNAVQVEKAGEVGVRNAPAVGEGVGAENKPEVPAQEGEAPKEEVIPEGPQSNADNLNKARARIQADPTLPEKLIARIVEGGLREISDQDVFTLLAHEENLKAQEDQWRKQYLDDKTSDIDRATAEGKLDQLEKDLTRTSQAIDKAGSIKGRGLQALKLRAMEDFSEDAILYRMRKSKGDALTPEEKNQARDIANRYAELQKQEDQINQKREEAEQTTELREAYQNALKEIEDLKTKAQKSVKKPTSKQESKKPPLDQRIVNKLNALAEKVRQERKGKLYARISPVDVGDVIIGASHIANGLKSFKDWSVKMVEDLGERVKPHLDRLWEAANAKIDALSKGNTPEDVRARIKAEAVAGEELSPKSVGDLVKAHLEEGLRGENEVMQAVHQDVKEAYPDASERDVRRAFVDFNKEFKPLSKDEILTRSRQLKTLVRLQENIDRLEEGLPALKSQDRDKAIQEIRDKRKQLNDLLAKTRQPTAEEHLATQNEAKKTRLRNAIEDLEKQLKTGERPKPKVYEEEPQEIEDLRLEKEALQRLRDEVDRREAPKFSKESTENERLRKQYEKQIADLDEKLRGIEKPKAEKEPFQQSIENEQKMAERDAMRQKLKEIEKEEADRKKPSPEQKEIERLQNAIDDVNDKISKLEKNAPKEKKQPLTEYAKKLQEDLKKAKEQFKRVTGEEPKTPEQRYNEQRRKAWQKEIDRLKDKMNRKDFSEQPKKPKPILDQESRRVFEEKEKVKQEAREMEQRLQHESRTPAQKLIDRVIKIPYHFLTAIKVLGHGTVGMITHAGGLIWRPTRAAIYWRNFFRQFPLWLRPKYHARIIYDLIHDPEFQNWKDAGASIDPREEYTDYGMYAKWMGKFAAGGKRGFDALNLVRLEMNKKDWEGVSDEIKNNPEQAEASRKYIAAMNNKATGALPQGYSAGRQIARNPYMDWLFFAPKLYATRFSRVLFDPVRTIKTFADWKSATPAEKDIALKKLRNAAEFSATYIGALLVNQALLQQAGSKQQVNFTDPSKTDWLKFKIGNKVVMADGGLLDPIRLIGRVVYGDLIKPRTERQAYLKGNRYQQAMKDLTEYVRGKMNPTLGIITDISTGTDFQGRPLPAPLNRGEKAKYADQPQYTWKEWLLEQGPIPLSGATKDVYQSMREKGLSDVQSQEILKAAVLTAVGLTGAHAQEDYSLLPKNPPRKSRSSSSSIQLQGGSGGSHRKPGDIL